MKRLSGFSLMEMMIVLTIIAIVAAASAPMVNKKMVVSQSNENIWSRAQDRNSIFFNDDGANNSASSVRIGSRSLPWGSQNPRLYIRNRAGIPHMEFSTTGGLNNPIIRLYAGNNENIWFATGNPADGVRDSVALGFGARATNLGVTIGANANSIDGDPSSGSVVIGNAARTQDDSQNSVVIGNMARTFENSANSVVIGQGAITQRNSPNSVAIGSCATIMGGINNIVIGSANNASQTKDENDNPVYGNVFTDGNSAIAIGVPDVRSSGTGSIAIGPHTRALNNGRVDGNQGQSIAIGSQAKANCTDSIALGAGAHTDNAQKGIAIGYLANVGGEDGIAIGTGARASSSNSVAIGTGVTAERENEIVIGGDRYRRVFIPCDLVVNNLVVRRNVIMNREGGATIQRPPNMPAFFGALLTGSDSDWGNARYREYHKKVKDKLDDTQQAWFTKYLDPTSSGDPFSDRRLKNVGKAFVGGLAELKKLDLYNYTFKDDKDKTPRVGVMAQDLQKIFPDAVFKGDDGFLRIRMEDMFYAVINAVKELDLRISSNSKKIEELEKQNQELLKQNEEFIKLNEKCLKQNAELLKRIEALEKAKK